MEFPLVLEVAGVAVVVLEVFQRPITVGKGYPLLVLFSLEGSSSFGVEAVAAG